MSQMTGGEAIVKSLESQGVEYVFGMAGHANLAFLAKKALLEQNPQFSPKMLKFS